MYVSLTKKPLIHLTGISMYICFKHPTSFLIDILFKCIISSKNGSDISTERKRSTAKTKVSFYRSKGKVDDWLS